jgi:hypothetical protein
MASTDANPGRSPGNCVGYVQVGCLVTPQRDVALSRNVGPQGRSALWKEAPRSHGTKTKESCPFPRVSFHIIPYRAMSTGQVIKLRRRDKMDTFVKHLIISTGETKTAPATVAREK